MAVLAGLALVLASAGCRRGTSVSETGDGAVPRIISLAPNLTEIIFAVGAGDRLVGRTDVCNWPAAATAIPVVGSFGRPSMEVLLMRKPTLVLTADLENESVLEGLKRSGIAHRRIDCRTLDQIAPAIREIGRLAGEEAAGRKLGDELADAIEQLRASTGGAERPSTFIEIWGDPLMTAGRNSFVSELVQLAGYSNLASDVQADYFTVSPEWAIARDPEVVICLYMSRDRHARRRVEQRVGWRSMRAVRNGAVFDGFNTDRLYRPGPRVLEGVEELRQRLADYREARLP